jgi:hypothetical protein
LSLTHPRCDLKIHEEGNLDFAKIVDALADISIGITDVIQQIVPIPSALDRPLGDAVVGALYDEDRVFDFPAVDWQTADLSIEERFKLRNFLRDKRRFLIDPNRTIEQLTHILSNSFAATLERLPDLTDGEGAFTVPLVDVIESPGDTVALIMGAFHEQYAIDCGLFEGLRERFVSNVCRVISGAWVSCKILEAPMGPSSQLVLKSVAVPCYGSDRAQSLRFPLI